MGSCSVTTNKQSATKASLQFVKDVVPRAVNALSCISICAHALSFYACSYLRASVRACIHQTGNWQAADPLWVVFIFHSLPVSRHKALAFSFFFPFIFSFIPFSSQYLPGYNCDMNHFRQGEAQRCGRGKKPSCKKKKKNLEKEKLYFDSHGARSYLTTAPCVTVFISWVILGKNISIWVGRGAKWDALHKDLLVLLVKT